MSKVYFTGWQSGFQKVQFNALLRERLGMSLSEAKILVDKLLSNESVLVTTLNVGEATYLLTQAQALGVVGELALENTSETT